MTGTSSYPVTANAPVAWQYRENLGSDWGDWFCLNIPIEKFKEDEKDAFEDGLYEIRPLYAAPQHGGVAQRPMDRDEIAKRISFAHLGDDREWKGFRSHADRFLAYALPSTSRATPSEPRVAERLADVVMMLDTPDAYNREYIAAVCRSILSSMSPAQGNTP